MNETRTNPIPDRLREEVRAWGTIGHHSLLQRYLLAVGKEFTAQPLPKKYPRGRMRECYRNAIRLATRHPAKLRYAEGYALGSSPLLMHHAWAVDAEDRVVDPTWEKPEEAFYFGRVFTLAEYERETDRTGTTSMLDGVGLNHVFMFAEVPGLQEDVAAAMARRKVAA